MQKFSQNRTQYLFDNSSIDHGEWADNLQNRLNNAWIVCTSWGENTWAWHMTVSRIFNWRKKSNDQ